MGDPRRETWEDAAAGKQLGLCPCDQGWVLHQHPGEGGDGDKGRTEKRLPPRPAYSLGLFSRKEGQKHGRPVMGTACVSFMVYPVHPDSAASL